MDANSFAETLTRLRRRTRFSQARLARSAGFDHSYMSRLESGNRMPTRSAVEKISDTLELTPEDRDDLLISAGFLPVDFDPVAWRELRPLVSAVCRDDLPGSTTRLAMVMLKTVVRALGEYVPERSCDEDTSRLTTNVGYDTRNTSERHED